MWSGRGGWGGRRGAQWAVPAEAPPTHLICIHHLHPRAGGPRETGGTGRGAGSGGGWISNNGGGNEGNNNNLNKKPQAHTGQSCLQASRGGTCAEWKPPAAGRAALQGGGSPRLPRESEASQCPGRNYFALPRSSTQRKWAAGAVSLGGIQAGAPAAAGSGGRSAVRPRLGSHTGTRVQSRPAQRSSQNVFFKLTVQIMTFFYPTH